MKYHFRLLLAGIVLLAGCSQGVTKTNVTSSTSASSPESSLVSSVEETTVSGMTFEMPETVRPRTIITTDLECDDICALIHMLLYTNEIDLDGIVVSSSCYHWTGDGEHTQAEINNHTNDAEHQDVGNDLKEWRPMDLEYLEKLIKESYAKDYVYLSANDERYPTPEELLKRVYFGNYEFEGDTRYDTDGSNFIKECLLDDDSRDLYLEAWGGSNTIARALMSIEEEYSEADNWNDIYTAVCDKGILISFGDQDTTYEDYISVKWPDLTKLYCVTDAYGYGMENKAPLDIQYTFKGDWLTENIKFNHGAMLSEYPLIGDGIYYNGEIETSQFGDMEVVKNSWLTWLNVDYEQYDFISEGDAPCFMLLIPNGLRGTENTSYGSWGGRIVDGVAANEYDPTRGEETAGYSAHRWLYAYQNDFAARADWCVSNYADCNHQPLVTAQVLDYIAEPGAIVDLKGLAYDPDGDALSANWFVYTEASSYDGSYSNVLDVWKHNTLETSFTVPTDAKENDSFNIVLEVSDDGMPSLTRYAQVIITVAESVEE